MKQGHGSRLDRVRVKGSWVMTAPRPALRWVKALAGLVAMASAAVWDEVFFAAPVVFSTARMGPWLTLSIVTPVFWVIGTGISLLVVRSRSDREPSRLVHMVQTMEERTRTSKLRRQLVAGSVIGFVLCSWILGGILTSYILAVTALRIDMTRWIIVANVIWAITFVGQYAGIASFIF